MNTYAFFWAGADSQGKIVTGCEEGVDGMGSAMLELSLLPRMLSYKRQNLRALFTSVFMCVLMHMCSCV